MNRCELCADPIGGPPGTTCERCGDAAERSLAVKKARAEGVAAGLRMARGEAERAATEVDDGQGRVMPVEAAQPLEALAAWCEAAAKDAEKGAKT